MYTPIDALNHGYHYETIKIEIPHDSFIISDYEGEEEEYCGTLADLWYNRLDNTIRNNLRPKTFWIEDQHYRAEKVIADSALIQIRTTVYHTNWVVVIVRETPHDYEQYIHNLSGVHVNRIAKILKTKLAQEGYQVS